MLCGLFTFDVTLVLLDSTKCTNKILTHIDIFEESLGNIMGFCSFYFWCIWADFCGKIGLGFSRRGVPGKMVYQEQTVLFLQSGTGLTNFRSRTKLEVSFISLLCIFREHQVVLVELLLITGRKSQFLLIFHMVI